MIPGRMGCHATSRSFVIKCKNGICGTSCLECTDLLKIFALKKQRRAARVIQPRICQDGRAMNVWANSLVRCAKVIELKMHDPALSYGQLGTPAESRCSRAASQAACFKQMMTSLSA
jgi:hypothetical protein